MSVSSYSRSASLNVTLGTIAVAEGMARDDVDDAIRQQMADTREFYDAVGTNDMGALPAGSFVGWTFSKTASGYSGGSTDLRAWIDIVNYTGAFGAAQVNLRNMQHNLLHTAGTVSQANGIQGYSAVGVPSTITTTGDVSNLQGIQYHISHTGSGTIGFAAVFSAMGLDADIGTGTVVKFHNYHSDDIAAGSVSRLTTEGFGYFQANSSIINTPILAAYGSEMSWDATGKRWSIYFSGGASSFIGGRVRIGGPATAPTDFCEVVGGIKALSSGGTIAALGYGVSAGGTATQATSKATTVTLNSKACGAITMNAAALAANTIVTFTFTNDQIGADDDVRMWVKGGNATPGSYRVAAEGNASGNRTIIVENKTAGSLSEALVLGFNILKAVIT